MKKGSLTVSLTTISRKRCGTPPVAESSAWTGPRYPFRPKEISFGSRSLIHRLQTSTRRTSAADHREIGSPAIHRREDLARSRRSFRPMQIRLVIFSPRFCADCAPWARKLVRRVTRLRLCSLARKPRNSCVVPFPTRCRPSPRRRASPADVKSETNERTDEIRHLPVLFPGSGSSDGSINYARRGSSGRTDDRYL